MSVTTSASDAPARPTDIIDLDRYMRAAVRPSAGYRSERWVVDGGEVGRRPIHPSSKSHMSSSETERTAVQARDRNHKRLSHDSGVSDGSYVKRKRRPQRRVYESSNKSRESNRGSPESIREFRAVCERALREQQEQISRVTQLCEKLAQPKTEHPPTVLPKHETRKNDKHSTSSDTSLSLSIPASDKRRAKLKPDTCKTYKLIMTKLDDLNRVFVARRGLPPHGPPTYLSPSPRRAPACLSSGSVSVCDKLVATESRRLASIKQTILSSGMVPASGRLEIARANKVDIAPTQFKRNNIIVESVVESGAAHGALPAGDGRYTDQCNNSSYLRNKSSSATCGSARQPSLCALCRGYWRALCRYLPNNFNKNY